jgi:hypothetical protein
MGVPPPKTTAVGFAMYAGSMSHIALIMSSIIACPKSHDNIIKQ